MAKQDLNSKNRHANITQKQKNLGFRPKTKNYMELMRKNYLSIPEFNALIG